MRGDRPGAGRRLLDTALRDGIDSVPDAPMAMRELFDEFETVPDWVRPELVERGAAVWRRWGTVLFGFAGAETLEMYTESAVATPLSLAGGYAGDSALRRFLETCRFWMDVSQPGALLSPGSPGWATALKVRIMHVSVRAGVQRHPEWEIERWGLPISQTYQLLTLIAGSTIPGLGLWALGHQTTPAEFRALLHFQKYMGYLLCVRLTWHPETVADTLRVMAMTMVARSYLSGAQGAELIESYPAAFAPRPGAAGRGSAAGALQLSDPVGLLGPLCAVHHPAPLPDAGGLPVGARPHRQDSAGHRRGIPPPRAAARPGARADHALAPGELVSRTDAGPGSGVRSDRRPTALIGARGYPCLTVYVPER